MKFKATLERKGFEVFAYIVLSLFSLVAFVPFMLLVLNSFATEKSIINNGFAFFPTEFTFQAYEMVFRNPQKIMSAYGISIFITVVGTACFLMLATMASYVMFNKQVKYRNQLAFFLYFTTLFNGGLVSYYITICKTLGLKNSIFILLLGPMFNVMYILILRNFMSGTLSPSLLEAAKIDGAGEFTVFVKIVLPLMKAGLASVGLFTALGYWNDWWTAMMFMEKPSMYPLQYVLYQIISSTNMAASMVNAPVQLDMPKESLKLAMVVIAVGPMMIVYPFVQKYFVKGIMVGSVKG